MSKMLAVCTRMTERLHPVDNCKQSEMYFGPRASRDTSEARTGGTNNRYGPGYDNAVFEAVKVV